MKNRIDVAIEKAKKEGRVAFIGLVTIDPLGMEKTRALADTMISSGVDIIMIHLPNWMPWMEGTVLQRAAKEPRNAGITREDIFMFAKSLRKDYPEVPLVIMSLYDSVLTMGQEHFLELSEAADIDGFDLPNYPMMSTNDKFGFAEYCEKNHRHLILAFSYELAMAKEGTKEYNLLSGMAKRAHGFAFVMNAPGGQSGSAVKLSDEELSTAVARVKQVMAEQGNTDCTVSIVCGISNSEDVEKVKRSGAESFMIGSAYVKFLQDGKPLTAVGSYLKGIQEMCFY